MQKIAISGSSGFVGSEIVKYFKQKYTDVEFVFLNRITCKDEKLIANAINTCDGVINLAGESIFQRWTKANKKKILNSRVDTTKNIVNAFKLLENKPKYFISISAIGIYDSNLNDENSTNFNDDFLSHVSKCWEKEALKAKEQNIATSIFRLGVVLGKKGAMQKMLLPFKLGFGAKLGNAQQYFSWIHIKDLCKAFDFCIQNNHSEIFNLTTPNFITNEIFSQTFAKVLRTHVRIRVPEFLLKLLLGESSSILLQSKKVYPSNLLKQGFVFEFDTIESALQDLLR